MAGDDDEMFMTRSLNVTPKATEQHFIAGSDKSVAYVTNNKRLCSTFCTIEANYRHTRSMYRTASLRQQGYLFLWVTRKRSNSLGVEQYIVCF